MSEPSMKTRREFLRTGLLGGALTWTMPGFVHLTMQSLAQAAQASALQAATGKSHPILVVLQLAGGNDGLNTVVPYENDLYYKARPNLAIVRNACLPLADGLGLHPALEPLKSLFDDGRLAVLQGVGYPNPNRSHFRSMEIWQTASEANRVEQRGWIGRYFDCCCPGLDATAGVSLGQQAPQAFLAARPKGVTLERAENYRYRGDEAFLRNLVDPEQLQEADLSTGDSIRGLGTARPSSGSPLDFLERTSLDAQVSSDRIRSISRASRNEVPYPSTKLGRDMALVAGLIAGELPTRVYYVSQGGFDTHANQKGTHQRLLGEFAGALKAFIDDLSAKHLADQVAVMVFSEFGRRVKENASGGTDHGAASPMFVAGGRIRAGIYGQMPSLAPQDLLKGDLRHAIDFRSVYATIIEKHLGTSSRGILRGNFPTLDFI